MVDKVDVMVIGVVLAGSWAIIKKKEMKRVTIILYLIFIIGQTNAQYLVVGNSNSGGNYISFQDTILYSIDLNWGNCSSFDYYFDLDQDSIPDIDFYLDCYFGGMGSFYKIFVTSFNDFSIHTDTCYIEHFQFLDSLEQAQDTTRRRHVVRKYNLGDTIFNNQSFLSTEEIIMYYSNGWDPSCIYNNINLFLEDTSYIAFEKSNGDLYYFKNLCALRDNT